MQSKYVNQTVVNLLSTDEFLCQSRFLVGNDYSLVIEGRYMFVPALAFSGVMNDDADLRDFL